jgi:phospholipid/cholesterol/gamma-HCH transport system substrate-binding protein
MLPGAGKDPIRLARSPKDAEIIEGDVATDPSKALAAATIAFEKAGDTLESINAAANGLAKLSKNADQLDGFLKTWNQTGQDVSGAAQRIDGFLKNNETDFRTVMGNVQKVAGKLNDTLTPETQDAFKTGLARFSSASARLDAGLADAAPLMKDLGAPVNHTPTTDFGQSVRRLNRVAADLELLSGALRTRKGTLNTDGSLQKLLTQSELHDNFNSLAMNASHAVNQLRTILRSFQAFAERISRDPAVLSRGALQR